MKTHRHFYRLRNAALTLVETIVSLGVAGVAGLVIFLFFNNSMILFAKNTAMNLSHENYREVFQHLQKDLHQAVSVPFYLSSSSGSNAPLPSITVNSVTYNGANVTTAAQGISFQVFGGTPGQWFEVGVNAQSGTNKVVITGSSFVPVVGQRLIVPSYQIEGDITAVSTTGSGNTALYTLTLSTILSAANSAGSSTLNSDITACSASNYSSSVYGSGITDYHIACYLTNRVCYLAVPISGSSPQAYQLLYYPCYNATYNTKSYSIITNLYTATPFQVATVNGANNQQYVALTMAVQDQTVSQRGYKVLNYYFTTNMPYRNALTNYQ